MLEERALARDFFNRHCSSHSEGMEETGRSVGKGGGTALTWLGGIGTGRSSVQVSNFVD